MGGPKRTRYPANGLLRDVFADGDLPSLAAALDSHSHEKARGVLLAEFFRVAVYNNAEEWNRAVRLCEALAIVGWGDCEPLEAIRSTFFNGNPLTMFVNRLREKRFVDAIWSKRTSGLTMENGRTSYHQSPDAPGTPTLLWDHPVLETVCDVSLAKQRNWIAKNPIFVGQRIGNCYESTRPLADDIRTNLMPLLDTAMRPEAYGTAVQGIRVFCSFSYYDNSSCKCNYVTFGAAANLKPAELRARLSELFSKEEISEMGYFARNTFEFGRFMSSTGTCTVTIHFPKEFSELSVGEQKKRFTDDVVTAIGECVGRLGKKKLPYNFLLMHSDLIALMNQWSAT